MRADSDVLLAADDPVMDQQIIHALPRNAQNGGYVRASATDRSHTK
jgi:hypothetical protein